MPQKASALPGPSCFTMSLTIAALTFSLVMVIPPLSLPGLGGCSMGLASETGFQGRVTDLCSQEPIAGAVVSIKALGRSVITGSDGTYQLSAPPSTLFGSRYEVSVQAVGYIGMSNTLQRVFEGKVTRLDFEMVLKNPSPWQRKIIDSRLMLPEQSLARIEKLDDWSRERGFSLPSRERDYLPAAIRVLMPDGHVEVMDMDEYLKGVLPREMATGWPQQALRAQAVAARCYAATQCRHADQGADVCTTTHCQAWSPLHYGDTDQAVVDTQRVVATYAGSIIEAYYFAHCDGHTRNVEEVWINYLPYCRSVWCGCGYTSLYGHGVGLCQRGAQAMANQGIDYRRILEYYYPGAMVQDIPPDPPSSRFSSGECVEVMSGHSLELRSGPGEDCRLITTLLEGSKGEVADQANNGQFTDGHYWWYVRFGKSVGWGRESCLEECGSPSFGITIGEEGKWQLGCFLSTLKPR
ncbi:MAG: SpoIID/LytB domain-containing protein [bacterium]